MPKRYYKKRSNTRTSVRYGRRGANHNVSGFGKGFKWGYNALWSAVKNLKGLINVEKKYVDTDIANNTNITGIGPTNSLYALLNGVAQGDTENQRNGHSIRIKGISMSWDVKFTTGGNATQLYRWALLRHPDPEGVAPIFSKIWEAPATFDSLRNLDDPHEVQFIREGRGKVDANTLVRHYKVFVPLNFREVFQNTTNLIASISRNALWFYIWSDTAANFPTMSNFVCRVRYIDN